MPRDRRSDLARLLAAHRPFDARESACRDRMLDLVGGADDPFARSSFRPGHFTASGFVLDARGTRLLLIHHAALSRWLQPGGHAHESDADLEATARREVLEETGVRVAGGIERPAAPFDLDVHPIPARGSEPSHEHFDVRFLFRSDERRLTASPEVRASGWVSPRDAERLIPADAAWWRVFAKLRTLGFDPDSVD